MLKKYLPLIVFLLLFAGVFWSTVFSPLMRTPFVIAIILFSLAISISSILKKHKGAEDHRQKITRDILAMIAISVLVLFIGGWAGFWIGKEAAGALGAIVGFLCAVSVSFVVGYLIQKGMRKIIK